MTTSIFLVESPIITCVATGFDIRYPYPRSTSKSNVAIRCSSVITPSLSFALATTDNFPLFITR
ncbi:hypothetical protein MASR1M68_08370 [Elusimicrobiota bacterium]